MKETPHSICLQRSTGKVPRRQSAPQWKAVLSKNPGSQQTGGEDPVRGTIRGWMAAEHGGALRSRESKHHHGRLGAMRPRKSDVKTTEPERTYSSRLLSTTLGT